MDLDIIHYDDSGMLAAALFFKVNHERHKCIDGVAASKYSCVDQPILDTKSSYHRNRLESRVWHLHLHPRFIHILEGDCQKLKLVSSMYTILTCGSC